MLAAWISVGLIALICVIVCVVEHETKKRNDRVRLPRRTLWAKTHDYHGNKT